MKKLESLCHSQEVALNFIKLIKLIKTDKRILYHFDCMITQSVMYVKEDFLIYVQIWKQERLLGIFKSVIALY